MGARAGAEADGGIATVATSPLPSPLSSVPSVLSACSRSPKCRWMAAQNANQLNGNQLNPAKIARNQTAQSARSSQTSTRWFKGRQRIRQFHACALLLSAGPANCQSQSHCHCQSHCNQSDACKKTAADSPGLLKRKKKETSIIART